MGRSGQVDGTVSVSCMCTGVALGKGRVLAGKLVGGIPILECNRALPENVLFVNNIVIEEPEYGIFFTDKFGDQAFQRWSDIDKEGMEALVSYLVAASTVKYPKNERFSMKLRKLIAEHPDQEKLKSKKVKLEALG
nr:hypothetical protein [Tanacetum cinerariifolium]